MKRGWLVNDTLTCIPDTKTFWHDLLDNLSGLEDKTFGYTSFDILPQKIENLINTEPIPDYIIRNASFFRPLNLSVYTISLLQDCYDGYIRQLQMEVCNSSDIVVCNSCFIQERYTDITSKVCTIPIGVDFDFFYSFGQVQKDKTRVELGILPDSILFVGANNVFPKGFDKVLDLIDNTSYNFCLVMKDDFFMEHPRVRCFNRVGHNILLKIYNSCKILICTSQIETLHLSGIEAAACGLPIIATNVGTYYNREHNKWGMVSDIVDFKETIKFIFENYNKYSPRDYFLEKGFAKQSCMNKWKEIISF